MPKVRMNVSVSGVDQTLDAGKEYDLPADLAKAYCEVELEDGTTRAELVGKTPASKRETRSTAKKPAAKKTDE